MIMSEKEYIQNYCPKADKYFYWTSSLTLKRIVRRLASRDIGYDFINSRRGEHWINTNSGPLIFQSLNKLSQWIKETEE